MSDIDIYISDCEYDPDAEPTKWAAGSGEEKVKRGDKPPKGGKGRKGAKKPKDQRANPDFDIPGYEGLAFRAETAYNPPPPPQPPTTEAPPMTFTDSAKLSEDDCRKALQNFVGENFCFGSKPVEEMTILETMGVTALHYKLESFTEERTTKKKKKPYKGGHVDGPENGPAPMPWEMHCEFSKSFKDDKIKKEVPHTAKVKKCKDCKGRGWETCDDCDGWGQVECDTCDNTGKRTTMNAEGEDEEVDCFVCNGDGMRTCLDCGGDGRVTCDDCDGYGKLRCFIQLKVKYINHDDEYILETTDMPDELVAGVGGSMLFEQELPRVWPITCYPVAEINNESIKMTQIHSTKWPNQFMHKQRQTLRGVPVTEVHYKWDDNQGRYWVYGAERKVYCPDYPQQCCWGCSVL